MATMAEFTQIYLNRERYLRLMPEDALRERTVHLLNNCVRLDQKSMIQLCAIENPDMFTRLMDCLAETGLRYGTITGAKSKEMWDQKRNVLIKPSAEIAERAKILEARIPTRHSGLLFRFSSYQYMEELLNEGGLLLQWASSYKSQENLSVRDDELSLEFNRYISAEEAGSVPLLAHIRPEAQAATRLSIFIQCPDFLTLCLTDAVNYRLISDWQAEAAVIIHDPVVFRKRLANGAQHLLGMNKAKALEHGKVHYLDPYFPLPSQDVPFCKHFKFSYQREFRFVIRAPEPVDFNSRKIFLGSLADIATLVDLR